MPVAFVLIKIEMGSMEGVLKDLGSVEGVKEDYSVYGICGIIAKAETETMDKLRNTVTYRIRRLNNVRTTLTMIASAKL